MDRRAAVEAVIRVAFAGVTLGGGLSLRQALSIDRRERLTPAAFAALRRDEIVDDWSRVPVAALESDGIAHLDADGLRYYLPALMLRLLADYQPASLRCIATLSALYPRQPDPRHAVLSSVQSAAIADFLTALPDLVPLDREDAVVVSRSLRNHWGRFVDT